MNSRIKITLEGEFQGHRDRVWDAEWSSDGKRVASVSGDKSIRVWRRGADTTFTSEVELHDAHEKTVRRCAWHPREEAFACASFDGSVSVWDKGSGADWVASATLEGHENEVKGVSWNRDGSLLATCGRDKTVWVWAVSRGAGDEREYDCLAVLRSHTQDVKCVFWHPREDTLFSASYDNTLRAWRAAPDTDEWVCAAELDGAHTSTVWGGACAPAGDELVSCSDDSTVVFWARADGAWRATQIVSGLFDTRPVYGVAWSPDGLVACAGGDNSIKLLARDGPAGKFALAAEMKNAHESDVNSVAWCPVPEADGSRLLVSAGDDNTVKLWRVSVNP